MSNAEPAPPKVVSKDDLRGAILNAKPKSVIIELFGQKVELRQPTMGNMFKAQQGGNTAQAAARMLIEYAHVPGTDEKLFESGDVDAVMALPWGNDLLKVQSAIGDLTGIDRKVVDEAVRNFDESPEE